MSGKVKVWGNVGTVEWADPIEDPDPEVMAKVTIVKLKIPFEGLRMDEREKIENELCTLL
jgi:hypothetical protein